MKKYLLFILPIVIIMIMNNCATFHHGRTVGKDKLAISASTGGPFINNLGVPFPIPSLILSGRYGVTENLDIGGSINIQSMILPGVYSMEFGVNYGFIQNRDRGFNLALGVYINFATDFQTGVHFFPYINFAGGYKIDWFYPYIGFDFGIDFSSPRIAFNPYLGIEFEISKVFSLITECKYYVPYYQTSYLAADFVGFGGYGAIGVIIGAQLTFDLKSQNKEQKNNLIPKDELFIPKIENKLQENDTKEKAKDATFDEGRI